MASLRLLLVEDDPGEARLLRADLPPGVRLAEATTLADGLAAAADGAVDVVLLDLSLPDSSGIDTVREWQASRPDVPVVVLTGHDSEVAAVAAVEAGAQDYLVKGTMGGRALLRVARYARERHRMQRHLQASLRRQERLTSLLHAALEEPEPSQVAQRCAVALLDGLPAAGQTAFFAYEDEGPLLLAVGTQDMATAVAVDDDPATLLARIHADKRRGVVDVSDERLHLALPASCRPARIRSVAFATVATGDHRTGILVAYADRPGAFDEADLEFVDGVGYVAAAATRRWRAEAALRERVKEQTALGQIGRDLGRSDAADVLMSAARHLGDGMQWPRDAAVEITVDDTIGRAGGDLASDGPTIASPVQVAGRRRGQVRVGYTTPHPFLPQEHDLVRSAADWIGLWAWRQDDARERSASEERLRLMLDQLPAVVWVTDPDRRIVSSTGIETEGTGATTDDLVGSRVDDWIDEEHLDAVRRAFDAALEGRSALLDIHALGRIWNTRTTPLRAADGTITGTLNLSLDVTEEREREQELEAVRRRLEGLWANAGSAMLLTDDTGRFVDANPAAEALTGYARHELIGQTSQLLSDQEPAEVSERWETFQAAGAASGDFTVVQRDGRRVETTFRAVANIVPGVHLAVLNDITERVQAERELARSEARFRVIAESAQDAIYRVRIVPDFAVEYVNPAVVQITGFRREDFAADPHLYRDRCHPEDAPLLHPARLVSGETQTTLLRFRHADGRWLWLEDRRTGHVEDGVVVGLQGIVRDVTAQQRTEEALRDALERERRSSEQLRALSDLKTGFIQAVSHELRTPLSAILGYAQTLAYRDDRLDAAQRSHFHRRVADNAARLERLLSDILDLERLGRSGRIRPVANAEVDVTIERAIADVEHTTHDVDFRPTGLSVAVDPVTLERIVANLVGNAVKHTPPGTRVTVRAAVEDEATLVVTVADDGPGIPEGLRTEIFEPFRQGPQMAASPSPGTGIGLSLVRQLAAAHGGTAEVDASEQGGARFRVRLSLGQVPTDTGPVDEEHETAPPEVLTAVAETARPGDVFLVVGTAEDHRDLSARVRFVEEQTRAHDLAVEVGDGRVAVLLRRIGSERMERLASRLRRSWPDRHTSPLDVDWTTVEGDGLAALRRLLDRPPAGT